MKNITLKNVKEVSCTYKDAGIIDTYKDGDGIYLVHITDFEEREDRSNYNLLFVSICKSMINYGMVFKKDIEEAPDTTEVNGVSESLFLKSLAIIQDPNIIKEL